MKLLLALCLVALASADILEDAKKQFEIAFGEPFVADHPKALAAFALPNADEFEDFIKDFGKEYKDEAEKQARFYNFQINGWIAQALQSLEQGTATYGVTKFFDMTPEEFKATYRNMDVSKARVPFQKAEIPSTKAPESIDWREKGAVTGVKDQKQCGSCWSFSTTGNVEGQWFLKKGELISLSEQQFVDCDHNGDEGCNGGLPSNAYEYAIEAGGIEREDAYPYKARSGTCKFDKSKVVVTISSQVAISQDEGEMATWCAANGPISIGINAGPMQYYTGGVSHPRKRLCNPKNLDHGVLIVGYGTEGSTPYWIIKNSWGTNWGEQGYYRIYRGGGCCGLNTMCTSAVV
jgi:cathepsin F